MKIEHLIYNVSNAMPQFASTRKSIKPKKNRVTPCVLITEVLHHSDPRFRTPEAEKARELKIENLVCRGT